METVSETNEAVLLLHLHACQDSNSAAAWTHNRPGEWATTVGLKSSMGGSKGIL
jgi:hypothetical protein